MSERPSNKKILIVDDSKDVIQLIASNLKEYQSGIELISASNGQMAIEVAKEELPNLIIMDWDMPVMNGLEATRRLKNSDATHNIPIIIATGRMISSDDLQLALEAGGTDYVRKPIDFIELRARMNTALRIAEQNKAIQELLRNDLELKDRKLSTTSMLIVEKNALLKEFYDELSVLNKLNTKDPEAVSNQIKKLQKRVQNNIEVDNSWDTFKVHFDEVHPDFFSQLSKFDVSQKDLKLCAYLRMRMDNKQISRLLNVTPASMRTALYRLKKKMRLEEEQDLREYILAI